MIWVPWRCSVLLAASVWSPSSFHVRQGGRVQREKHRNIMVLLIPNLTIPKEFLEFDLMWETPHADVTIKINVFNLSFLPSSTWITYKMMRCVSPESNCSQAFSRVWLQRLWLQGRSIWGERLKIRDRHQSAYSLIHAEQEKREALYLSQFAHRGSLSECRSTITAEFRSFVETFIAVCRDPSSNTNYATKHLVFFTQDQHPRVSRMYPMTKCIRFIFCSDSASGMRSPQCS